MQVQTIFSAFTQPQVCTVEASASVFYLGI